MRGYKKPAIAHEENFDSPNLGCIRFCSKDFSSTRTKMSLFPKWRMILPAMHRIRHTPDIWPSYDRFFPSLWESFHSPWYRKPALGTSYTYIEFTETGEGTRKKETKDVEGEKETPKSAEKFVDDRESFKVSFDVSKFKPEEITIRSEDGELVVEGKQEMKNDEGYSTRHFVRSYSLPRNIDRDSFQSRLSKEGILSIEAKKLQQSEAKDNFIKIETEE